MEIENAVQQVTKLMGIDAQEIQTRRSYLKINNQDGQHLKSVAHKFAKVLPGILDSFYAHLSRFEHARIFFEDPQTIQTLKKISLRYFTTLFSGEYDHQYTHSRLQIGIRHQRIGLDLKWYMGAYCNILDEMFDVLVAGPSHTKLRQTLQSLLRQVFYDLSLACDAYSAAGQLTVENLRDFAENIICNIPIGILVVDAKLHIQRANSFFDDVFKISHIDLKGQHLHKVLNSEPITQKVLETFNNNLPHLEIPLQITLHGKDFIFNIETWKMRNYFAQEFEQKTALVMLLLNDETEQVRAQEKINKLAMAVEQTADMIMITDANGVIEYVNESYAHTTGFHIEEFIGNTPKKVKSGVHKPAFYQKLWQTLKSGQTFREVFVNRKKNGSLYYEEKTITPLFSKSGTISHFVSTGKNITDQINNAQQLQTLMYTHPVTNLPNRSAIVRHIQRTIRDLGAAHDKAVFALLHLNIDRFKLIIDSIGYTAADDILRKFASRLSATSGRVFVGHLGADDFIVLYRSDKLEQVADNAVTTAQRLLQTIAAPMHIDNGEFFLTASIGVSLFPEDGQETETLLANAAQAMRRSKNAGGNKVELFDSFNQHKAVMRMSMESALHRALQRKQFTLHYQPLVRLADGNITGIEALLRWQHPDQGLLRPVEFMSTLEETGMIVELGEWILFEACQQNKKWLDAGWANMTMAVNLSATQLQRQDIIGLVNRVIRHTGLPADQLQLEWAESAIMRDTHKSYHTLNTLRLMNIGLAIDNFGTGYSSLSCLKQFPFTCIKLAQAFIADLELNQVNQIIVRAIVDMAKGLNMQVSAEGVENTLQLAILNQYGCHFIQGNLFSRPLEANQFTQLLQSGKRL